MLIQIGNQNENSESKQFGLKWGLSLNVIIIERCIRKQLPIRSVRYKMYNQVLFNRFNLSFRGPGPDSERETQAYQKFFEIIEERYSTEVKGMVSIV